MHEIPTSSQEPAERLTAAVRRLRQRVRILQAERRASLGLAAGLGIGVLVRATDLLGLLQPAAWWYAVAAAVPTLFAWVWAFVHPPDMLAVAAAADARLGIKDRAASAIALRASGEPMTAALVADAADHVASSSPRVVFRRSITGRLWPPAAAGAALALLILLPQWPALQSTQTRARRAELKTKAQQLERLATDIEKRAEPETEDLAKQVAENMRRLARDLKSPRMTEKRALVEMKKTAAELKAAREKIEEKSAKKLAQASAELSQEAAQAAMAQQAERMRDLREFAKFKQAGLKDIETLEELAKLPAEDFEKFKDLPQLKGLNEEQLRRLAEIAKRTQARQLYTNLKMPQELLDRLSELFAKEDYLKALEIMQDLMAKLQQRLQDQQSGEAPKLTDEEIRRLQAELRKLAEILKNTNLDDLAEELRQLAEELSKMDIEELLRRLKECQGGGGFGVGLGLLPGLGTGIGLCAGVGLGPGGGVGPGNSMAQYVPGLMDQPSDTAQRVNAKFSDINIKGQFGEKGEVAATEVFVPPSSKGEKGKVPYYRVLPSYREQAEDALRREEVPPEHRTRVKRYFDSLISQ
jgi:hypothetical protein